MLYVRKKKCRYNIHYFVGYKKCKYIFQTQIHTQISLLANSHKSYILFSVSEEGFGMRLFIFSIFVPGE